MTDFIGIYNKSVKREVCNCLIELLEEADVNGSTMAGLSGLKVDRQRKDSTDLNSAAIDDELRGKYGTWLDDYFETLKSCYLRYVDTYKILTPPKTYECVVSNYNIQRYTAGGQAYHAWHYESAHPIVCHRVLAWMTYLNNVPKGGETEFFYYKKKLKPRAGTTLIWPSSFTHTHRGLPAPDHDKYIITGWFEFAAFENKDS
jgi:hypothetical protein